MKTIRLLGELGKKFGRKLQLDVKTPAEAVRALCANFPEFERHLVESDKKNVGYRVVVGKQDIDLDHLHDPAGRQSISIVPVIQGAGGSNPLTRILIGAAIIGAAFLTGGAALVAAPGTFLGVSVTTTFIGSIAVGVGASLVLGGIAQMLSPIPKAQDPSERPENQPSYVFDGAVNTTAQGQPVPIGYGRLIVGSAVVSAGITTEEIPI
jgi:predicted phage tail protein